MANGNDKDQRMTHLRKNVERQTRSRLLAH